MRKKLVLFVLTAALALAACTPGAATQDTMMEETPTGEMDAMMEETSTPEMETGMMEETEEDARLDAMMEKTGTPEMMEDQAMDAESDAMMDPTGTPEMMEVTHDDTMMDETPIPMTGAETPQAGRMEDTGEMMSPAWFGTPLTDEVTGETFTIEDFKGKVVLVETFAQWCPTCLRQQREMMRLHELLGMPDGLVSVSLDVDPNEDAATLLKYLEKHGFDWRFAVAPPETAREIGDLYGTQFLNPPSAPVLIIDRQGEVHPLPFGVKSAEDLQQAIQPFLSDGM